MKRLCIYVAYDREGIVDGYIGYMLQELKKVVDFLCVVCNYRNISGGMENVQPYADRIFYRENTGFDAGAYKDALCRYLGWDEVQEYDELVLANDSFFGPLYPFERLFKRMDEVSADYWGMTRCPEVELADGNTYGAHIQSYFLVFRKNILNNKTFRMFWEDMDYPVSMMQAVITFEIGTSRLLERLGFCGSAVMDLCPVRWHLKKSQNPYLIYPLELIRDAGIPVLKRKSLSLSNWGFVSAMGALRLIGEKSCYDVGLIENYFRRFRKNLNIFSVDSFYAAHSRVFIYGAGLYGKNIAEYFRYRGWRLEKFLVTDTAGMFGNCTAFAEADITDKDGIIVAAGSKKVFAEIVQVIETRCRRDQIFNPVDVLW